VGLTGGWTGGLAAIGGWTGTGGWTGGWTAFDWDSGVEGGVEVGAAAEEEPVSVGFPLASDPEPEPSLAIRRASSSAIFRTKAKDGRKARLWG
jgi:hypothetical protein